MFISQAIETAVTDFPEQIARSKTSEIHINQAWILLGGLTLVTTVTAFARNKLAAVVLGPAGIGIYAQGLTFLTFAATICTLGMGQGIIKHLAEREHGIVGNITRSQVIRRSLWVQLATASIVACGVIVFSQPLAGFLFGGPWAWKYVVVVGFTIPFTVLVTNFGYFLQGLKRLSDFIKASVVNAITSFVVFFILVLFWRLNGAVISLLTAAASGALIFYIIYLKKPVGPESAASEHISEDPSPLTVTLLKYGAVVFVSGVIDTLSALLLRTWIVNYSGVALNGIYQAVVGLSGQYIGFFMLFNNAYLFPKLSSIHSPEESTAEVNRAMRTGLLLAVPLIAGIIIFRTPLILLLFTREFLPATNVLVWQGIGDVLKITSWFLSASLLPRARLREYLGLSIFFAGLYLILSFTFLRKWNLIGLALAHCLAYSIYISVLLVVQARLMNFRLSSNSLAAIVASAALLFGVVWLPDTSGVYYVVKVGLVMAWAFSLDIPRFLASAMRALLKTVTVRGRTEIDPISGEGTISPVTPLRSGGAASETPRAVSVVVPVRNEAATIERLITSLQNQTYPPSEIVIADGGSTDDTQRIIRSIQSSSSVPIVLVEDRDAFPGRGRNLAILRASSDWLACIDAGIVPESDWLEELVLTSQCHSDKHLIQGRYQPVIENHFTECAAIAYVSPEATANPSVASCLLHRSAWEAAHGFPEDLRSGEDLIFFRRLQSVGAERAFSNRAIVHWQLQPDTASTFRRFATYSRYGMKAGLASDWQVKVSLVYIAFFGLFIASLLWWPLLLVPVFLLIARSQRRIYRWYSARGMRYQMAQALNLRRVLMVTWINFIIDLAMFRGMLNWVVLDLFGRTGIKRTNV